MKKTIAVLAAFILMLCSLTVHAEGPQSIEVASPFLKDSDGGDVTASFVFDEKFMPITYDTVDEQSTLINFLGLSNESMKAYFEKEGFLVFSISQDYTEQLYVIAEKNEISNAIVDLADIDDPSTVESLLLGDDGDYDTVTVGDKVFFHVVKEAPAPTDNQTEPTDLPAMVYYATVYDSTAFVVCYSSEDGKVSSEASLMLESFVNSMSLGRSKTELPPASDNNARIIMNWVFIGLSVAVIIYASISLIKDYKRKKLEEDFRRKTPKKPLR